LLREIFQKARASGLTRIELSVREGNASVIGLYENLICMGLLLD
jgi:ribosomal protein S18 acetylase RimI-like enzyme